MTMLRSVIAVVVGVVVGAVTVFVLEYLGHAIFPSTIQIDREDPEQMRRLVAATPFGAKLFVVAGWFAGAFLGGFASLVIARRWAPVAWVVATTVLGLTATNFAIIPHPLWMEISAVVGCAFGGWLAVALLKASYGPPPQPPKQPFA